MVLCSAKAGRRGCALFAQIVGAGGAFVSGFIFIIYIRTMKAITKVLLFVAVCCVLSEAIELGKLSMSLMINRFALITLKCTC